MWRRKRCPTPPSASWSVAPGPILPCLIDFPACAVACLHTYTHTHQAAAAAAPPRRRSSLPAPSPGPTLPHTWTPWLCACASPSPAPRPSPTPDPQAMFNAELLAKLLVFGFKYFTHSRWVARSTAVPWVPAGDRDQAVTIPLPLLVGLLYSSSPVSGGTRAAAAGTCVQCAPLNCPASRPLPAPVGCAHRSWHVFDAHPPNCHTSRPLPPPTPAAAGTCLMRSSW